MTPAATFLVRDLLAQANRLKALHRAGESPAFGQLEAFFDAAAAVEVALNAADPSRPSSWPTSSPASEASIEQAAQQLVELVIARVYAAKHAGVGGRS